MRWNGKDGPLCKHCKSSTTWCQNLDGRWLRCNNAEHCSNGYCAVESVDEPATGQEGVELVISAGRSGRERLRLPHRRGRRSALDGVSTAWRGWFAGAFSAKDDEGQDTVGVMVACDDGVVRWALQTELERDL